MILDLLSTLLLVALLAILAIGLLAPLESLHWWAGQPAEASDVVQAPLQAATDGPRPDPVIVYLSGIGSISGDELLEEEAVFLDQLQPLVPGAVIVRDVFPYSVAGVGLTGARVFSSFWQMLDRMRLNGDVLLSGLINLRNVFQVAVAADSRYGPIFSYGVAQVVAREAIKAGLEPGGTQHLILLGYSGGAQVAVGVAPFLRELVGVAPHIISLGGVLDSDPGMRAVSRMDHLVGDKDIMEKIGRIVYPGRWNLARASAWNSARREGVLHITRLAGMAHNTPGGYMDQNARTEDGQHFPTLTADAIMAAIHGETEPAA